MLEALSQRFCCSKSLKSVFLCYHLQYSFKIFIIVFAFLYVKANPKEIGEEIFFPYFFRKNADVRFKAYLEKVRGYPYFSFWIPIAFAKI